MRLDESALRKPEFRDGPRVRLADGQIWVFPAPRLMFWPALGPGGKVELAGGRTHDGIYSDLVEELIATDKDDLYAILTLSMTIVSHLLLLNYSLADADFATLLPVDFEDPENARMWEDLKPIIFAQADATEPRKEAADV